MENFMGYYYIYLHNILFWLFILWFRELSKYRINEAKLINIRISPFTFFSLLTKAQRRVCRTFSVLVLFVHK